MNQIRGGLADGRLWPCALVKKVSLGESKFPHRFQSPQRNNARGDLRHRRRARCKTRPGQLPSGLDREGGPVAWQVLLVHNRAALAEMSRVAVEDRFPLCVIDTIKASDVQIEVSFMPIAGKIDQAAGLMFRVKAILTHRG